MILHFLTSLALALPLAFASASNENELRWGFQAIDLNPTTNLTVKKKTPVIVAIIDTGIDVSHPDLQGHLWTNSGESGVDRWGHRKENNGIDDDDNGFVDDLHGWNFSNDNNDISDQHGHGTHIAGIIAKIAPEAQLMIIKYYDPLSPPEKSVDATPKSMAYARQMKAQIVNYSGGGPGENKLEKSIIAQLANDGILLVAAAGNEAQDSDQMQFFPADYDLPNILSVTAIAQDQKILSSSNYGVRSVHLAAPGNQIWSTLPGGGYGAMTGTSQATAFVTGVAALKLATLPLGFKAIHLAHLLINSGRWDDHLKQKLQTPVVVNSYQALAMKNEEQDAQGDIIANSSHLNNDLFLVKKAFELLED